MAKIANKDAQWTSLDVATLDPKCSTLYLAYKNAYKEMKSAREEFEHGLSAAIAPPAGKRVIFGYNFGKLSVAIVDGEPAKSKPTTGTQSLADWIAAQRDSGRGS